MTDLTIQSTPGGAPVDYSWLAGDGGAFENAQSGTLDVSTLTAGVHYDAVTGTVPTGLAVSFDAATKKFVPWAGAAVLDSFVAHPVELKRENGSLSTSVFFARIVDATIRPANLPVAAQRTIDRTTATTGKFGFVS